MTIQNNRQWMFCKVIILFLFSAFVFSLPLLGAPEIFLNYTLHGGNDLNCCPLNMSSSAVSLKAYLRTHLVLLQLLVPFLALECSSVSYYNINEISSSEEMLHTLVKALKKITYDSRAEFNKFLMEDLLHAIL